MATLRSDGFPVLRFLLVEVSLLCYWFSFFFFSSLDSLLSAKPHLFCISFSAA